MKIEKEYIGLKKISIEFSQDEIRSALIETALRVVDIATSPHQATFESWDDDDGKLVCSLVWTYRADKEEDDNRD